ncbi:LacI family DNA-binding transcriptional regulator [Coraliomargarita sp. SDUM461004]|uniref:LacI family DNA-binding transcriptional regulator n=1 Tax=Thalassobacterium sedimentorum TaxID=3041258 RepID=A0ABU1AJ04_9BACT|nr:LacI family DNA-binding transcriptional regulator [Coraliomargarita sp. SDUM461004]MDQ8194775.1 LacI family DNA-binding transcriptional regulator [Coraliomargarita sp. SDUM461004]
MHTSRRASLRDVAKLAGVSHVTVSRVVRENNTVAAATIAKVQAAIKQLNYKPDPALSALAAYRSNSNQGNNSQLVYLECETNNYNQTVFGGVKSETERLGYSLALHELPTTRKHQDILQRTFYHQGIRGILIGPSHTSKLHPNWDWTPFAAVSLSNLLHKPSLHAVSSDYFTGATLAIKYLRKQGIQRIGFAVNAHHEERTAHRWLGAYLSSLDGQKPAIYSDKINDTKAVKRWLQSERLDGLLTIHRAAFDATSSFNLSTVFLSQFECPATIPCISYAPQAIGVEGVRIIHHLCLNHQFGIPTEVKSVKLHPHLHEPELPI